MIPKSAIIEWHKTVPWQSNEQVEQDLIICRALVAIYQDEFLSKRLAFRGGTALHKLYLSPQPRYSEDIDLVQVNPEPIKPTIDRLREVLSFLGEPSVKQKRNNNTIIYKVESSIPPVSTIKLKIEINCREHFHVHDFETVHFKVESQWFSGECDILTYPLNELVGTKVRALYERRKGRDLFDLHRALQDERLDTDDVMDCFLQYMDNEGKKPSHALYTSNMDDKLANAEFLGDTNNLLRPGTEYDPVKSYRIVKEKLIDKLPQPTPQKSIKKS
jgi:predicted nucleotidyltransferase component of viral defense system